MLENGSRLFMHPLSMHLKLSLVLTCTFVLIIVTLVSYVCSDFPPITLVNRKMCETGKVHLFYLVIYYKLYITYWFNCAVVSNK